MQKKKSIKNSSLWNFIKKGKNKLSKYKKRLFPEGMDVLRLEYAANYEKCSINEKMILYEAYAGRGMVCSPYAIFKMFKLKPEFSEYTHVWSVESEEKRQYFSKDNEFSNVEFVVRDTAPYCRYLCTAKFLITNLSFPIYYTKKEGQVFINTWHGIPLKTLGFDIPEGRITGLNTIRNFLSVDVFTSPNSFMSERFKKSFLLEGISEGGIMETGMPRNDNLFHTEKSEIIKSLRCAGVNIDENKKLILYAPTWKGEKYSNPDTGTELYYKLMEEVEKHIDKKEYQVLVKPHQIVYKYIMEKGEGLTDRFIPADIDANELLSITDVLVSDYSSIYFDFLAAKKPIIFYIPDLEEYKEQRGLYFGIEKLPGPIAENLGELGKLLEDIPAAMNPFREKYEEERRWACGNDDGNVCSRVIDKIILNGDFSGLISFNPGKKLRLLLYSGELKGTKARNSLKKWADEVDYDKLDVTMIVPHTPTETVLDWIRELNPEVRVLRRTGKMAVTRKEYKAEDMIEKVRLEDFSGSSALKKEMEMLCGREILRTVGMAKFDYAADFSGKSMFFRNLFECMAGTKYISVGEISDL